MILPHILQAHVRSRIIGYRQTWEAVIFLVIFIGSFGYLAHVMGMANMMNTLMNTAYDLLISTVFFLMGITVLMGALSKLLVEFGVVSILEKMLRPLMRPLFNLPGVAALGAVVTFLSDNPAIISLSQNGKFARYFKTYQFVSLTNFGTAFGMGLVVVVFMMAQGYTAAPLIGVFGACVGCLTSTRLMQRFTLKAHPEYDAYVVQYTTTDAPTIDEQAHGDEDAQQKLVQKPGVFMRTLDAMLDGGKIGVNLGMAIIPGVLIISTVVMILTFTTADGEYSGAAYQGVGLLPRLADKVDFIFKWLFGFQNSQILAFPMTALGAVGAALGLVPSFQAQGLLDANAVAVCTAIGMCWSGFLSTHAAMLDSMGFRHLISKAISAHAIAGFVAGIAAHWAFVLYEYLQGVF
ncbi:MAG: nucleoside recognition domain-containing protein [Bacteroidales bacterium]|nr:nucleoside recognition domain-containing protein [Bacteroidales bacterium]